MAGVVINSAILEIKDTFSYSTIKQTHALLVVDFTSPTNEVMYMNNAFASLPGEPPFSEVCFARAYGGLTEVMLAAGVEAEPSYRFYMNGYLFDRWNSYPEKNTTPDQNVAELHRRVRALAEASSGCNRDDYYDQLDEPPIAQISPKQLEVFRKDFDVVDVDSSGMIDHREVGFLLKMQLGRKPTDQEIDCVVHAFDADNDGTIDFDEYMNWMLGEGWQLVDPSSEQNASEGPKAWSFKAGSKKAGRTVLTLFSDRMAVYQHIRPHTKGCAQLADRRIGFIKEESKIALVPMWTHVAHGIDPQLPMRASVQELNAQEIHFKLETTDDLLKLVRPASIQITDFITGSSVKLKGTKKTLMNVSKTLLK